MFSHANCIVCVAKHIVFCSKRIAFLSQSARFAVAKAWFLVETMRNDETNDETLFSRGALFFKKKQTVVCDFATQARRLAGTHNRMVFF